MTASELTATALKEEFENICDDFKEYEWSTYDNFEMNEESATVIKDALALYIKKKQGLIIELPVPIGSKYYVIDVSGNKVNEETLERGNPISFVFAIAHNYGKWVFAIREEAEARLKELRGEN